MANSPILGLNAREGVVLPSDHLEPRWYAAYTCANHEKPVRDQLEQRSVESFLPVYETLRRWKDRRIRLQLPLFPGYVFVRMALVDRLRVLQIPSVVRLVGFNGHPSALSDEEIDGLKTGLARGLRAEPHPFLTIGRRVRITAGPLAGHEGILVRRKGNLRVVLSIDLIQRSILVDATAFCLEPVAGTHVIAIPSQLWPNMVDHRHALETLRHFNRDAGKAPGQIAEARAIGNGRAERS